MGDVKPTSDVRKESSSGDQWAFSVTGPAVPNSPGPATLVGTVKFNGGAVNLSVPVVIR
jgi:hypothetical protein